ncbi:MAG: MFS transporter [Candidatus Andersenbacteria bacterium]
MSSASPSGLGFFGSMFAVRLKPELRELYSFSLLFSFAYALILIFEPVFLYKEGFSLSFISLYYALHYTIYVFLLPLGGKFATRFGLERSLSVSLPFFVMYFLVLALLPYDHRLIWLAIPLLTLHKIFYWPAFHAQFAKFGDSHNRGTELSWMTVLRYGVGILGPLIGGFVAAEFGFSTLFILTSILVLLSSVPLLKTKEHFRPTRFDYSSPWKIIRSRTYRNMTKAMAGMGENYVDMVFWPIFLFIVLNSTEKLGILSSMTIAIMTLMSFFVGEMSDRLPRSSVIRLHVPFMILGYLFRPIAGTPVSAFLTDTLNKMAFAGVNLPMLHKLYVQSNTTSIIRYTVSFEMVLAITKAIIAFVLVAVFAMTLPYTGFVIAFAIAGVSALFYLYL